eukprot:6539988-Prymnesium_polylepis.1
MSRKTSTVSSRVISGSSTCCASRTTAASCLGRNSTARWFKSDAVAAADFSSPSEPFSSSAAPSPTVATLVDSSPVRCFFGSGSLRVHGGSAAYTM